ncbi:MAG: S-layer homology domain-containing protein, partial [Clostridiales Family XIII bacterium]|nr:S-layer homology domain-containing protein [Clostridiales Family XIII bacterium]
YANSSFSDVSAGQYYTAYVEWAKANGIVNGVGDNLFAPNSNVSRQDFAVLLLRYADFAQKQFPTTRQFSRFADDTEIAGYARNAIQTLYNGGIINGIGGNAINPRGNATRAEVAAMLHRFIDASGGIEAHKAPADETADAAKTEEPAAGTDAEKTETGTDADKTGAGGTK